MEKVSESEYTFTFTEEMTQTLEPGWYQGYLQFCPIRQSVFYVYDKDHDTKILDTPYDDAVIPDVDIKAFTPDRIKVEFDKLEENEGYTDDILVPITVEIKDPSMQYTDYYEESDSAVISGTTTLSAGTNISFVFDPDKYVKANTLLANTVFVVATGEINAPRTFTATIPLKWDEISIDRHEIVGTIDKLKIHLEVTKDVDVTQVWVNPTQGGQWEKVIGSEGGWHRVTVTATPQITPSPEIIYIEKPTPPPQIVYVYVTNTTTPPTPTPTPTESPISPIIGFGAVAVVAALVLWRK
jgi:hypothetical protein